MPKACRHLIKKRSFSHDFSYFCKTNSEIMGTIKKLTRFFFHFVIWAIFFYIFIPNSFLRPFPFYHQYKEWIIGFALMGVCYLNYFILTPRIYLTGFVKRYWIIFLSLNLIFTALEFLLLSSDLQALIVPSNYHRLLIIQSFALAFIRNGGIIGLFFLLKTNQYYVKQYQKEYQTVVQKTQEYNITVSSKEVKTVTISEITYIQHQKNYTYFHLTDGSCYSQYISLSKVEGELPEGQFVRINRSTLASKSFPSKLDHETLLMTMPNGSTLALAVSPKFKDNIIQK